MNTQLEAGIGRRDITPVTGGRLMGYRPDLFSESVHDKLSVTAAAFCHGDTKVLIVSATLCLFQTELAGEIRALIAAETGFNTVILSATHTHSGPNTCGMVGWGGVDREYCDSVFIPHVKEAAKEAASSLKPVLMGIGTARSRAGVNRRQHNEDGSISLGQNPWGVFDPVMTVLSFTEALSAASGAASGRPVLSIVHYGAHCTAAGANTEISRDWAGVMLDRLETETGAPAMFINGAEGDVGPRLSNGKTTGDISHARELGGIAAYDALLALRNAKNGAPADLSVISGELVLPLKPRMPYETAQRLLAETPRDEVNIAGRTRQYYRNVIDAYHNNLPQKTALVLPQTLVAMGGAVLVPFPFEVFSEITLRLRAYSPFAHTLCMGITNGSYGYLPSQDQLCRGGYEVEVFRTWGTEPFADNTDDNIIRENLKLIAQFPVFAGGLVH